MPMLMGARLAPLGRQFKFAMPLDEALLDSLAVKGEKLRVEQEVAQRVAPCRRPPTGLAALPGVR